MPSDYDSVLWRWICPFCMMTIRMRTPGGVKLAGRQHALRDHETLMAVIPILCMWDARIGNEPMLVTYEY